MVATWSTTQCYYFNTNSTYLIIFQHHAHTLIALTCIHGHTELLWPQHKHIVFNSILNQTSNSWTQKHTCLVSTTNNLNVLKVYQLICSHSWLIIHSSSGEYHLRESQWLYLYWVEQSYSPQMGEPLGADNGRVTIKTMRTISCHQISYLLSIPLLHL